MSNQVENILHTKEICDVCDEKCDSYIGMRVRLTEMLSNVNDPDIIRLKETFGKVNFDICLRCWLLALGVKPKNSIIELEKRNERTFSEWKEFEAKWLKDN